MLFVVVLNELKPKMKSTSTTTSKVYNKKYKQNHENHKNKTLNFSLQKPNMFMYTRKKKVG